KLTPVNPTQLYNQPMERLGGSRPHDLKAGPLNLSPNWSGVVDEGSSAVFSGVQGDWTVPAVPSSASDELSSSWIGIDGVTGSTLIQTGTDQDSGPDYGGTQYLAWVELLPGAEEFIGNSSGPAPVEPGDVMAASIVENSFDLWTIAINDTTQEWSFSQQFSYSTPGTT